MKKTVSILLLLALSLTLACIPAMSENNVHTSSDVIVLDDFTVKTIDGADFTLSEALKDHELVLINLWATWCPPCRAEFPFLQEAWSKSSDTVSVIALSVEPTDTEAALKDFAEEMGLSFPVASVGTTGLGRFVTEGIPTTVLVDHTGKVAAVEIGAMQSTQEFLDLFDSYTGDKYDPALCTYTVYAFDDHRMLPDVTVSFCTDTACTNIITNEDGVAVYRASPAKYHLQLVDVPDDHQDTLASDIFTEPYSQTIYLYLP